MSQRDYVVALVPGALNDESNLAIVSIKIEQDGNRLRSWFTVVSSVQPVS